MMGELIGLGSALSLGISGLVLKPLSTKFSPFLLNALLCAAAWFFLACYIIPSGRIAEISLVSWESFGYTIGAGIMGIVMGNTFFIKSLSSADVARVFPIIFSFDLFITTIIAAIFLGEAVTWSTFLGAAVIVAGITLLSGQTRGIRQEGKSMLRSGEAKGILFAMIGGTCWAVANSLMKMGLREISPALFNFIRLPVVTLILSVLVWQREGMPELTRLNRRQVTRAAVAGILEQDVGMVLSFMAIQMIGVAKTALLRATSPLFVAPLAVIFLKEKMTWRVVLGTLLCVSGIWLIVG